MKKSWKKALLAGLSIVMMGSFIAGCGSNNGADNKDVLKVGVTNFASTLEPTENFFAWVVMRYGVGETLAKFDEQMKPQPWIASKWEVSPDHRLNMDTTIKIDKPGNAMSHGLVCKY